MPRVTATGTPLRVAVVGSGPAGFYAAGALLDAEAPIEVDMIERLPTPWGLVRLGVAPDHPKLKTVSRAFERIAAKPGFRFLGNVEVGRDLTHADRVRLYRARDPHRRSPGAGASVMDDAGAQGDGRARRRGRARRFGRARARRPERGLPRARHERAAEHGGVARIRRT